MNDDKIWEKIMRLHVTRGKHLSQNNYPMIKKCTEKINKLTSLILNKNNIPSEKVIFT